MAHVLMRWRPGCSLVVHQGERDERVRVVAQVHGAELVLGVALLSGLRPARRVSSLYTNSPSGGSPALRLRVPSGQRGMLLNYWCFRFPHGPEFFLGPLAHCGATRVVSGKIVLGNPRPRVSLSGVFYCRHKSHESILVVVSAVCPGLLLGCGGMYLSSFPAVLPALVLGAFLCVCPLVRPSMLLFVVILVSAGVVLGVSFRSLGSFSFLPCCS